MISLLKNKLLHTEFASAIYEFVINFIQSAKASDVTHEMLSVFHKILLCNVWFQLIVKYNSSKIRSSQVCTIFSIFAFIKNAVSSLSPKYLRYKQ